MRVVLDCDTKNEIDDQFAIAYALGCDDLDVLGVVSVQDTVASGPDSVDLYVTEARKVADLCGRPALPCPAGARTPMETPTQAVQSEGLDFIVEQAREAPLTLLATGPITDVASLALLHPDVLDRVHVVWAGAFPDERTWQRYRLGELNARADIAAWRALYAGDVRLTLLPGWPNIAKVAVIWRDYVRDLRRLGGPATDYLAEILQQWCAAREESHQSTDAGGNPSRGRKILWDVVNVAYLRNPSWLTLEERDLPSLDAAGAPDYSRPSRRAEVLVDLDQEAVVTDVWRALQRLPR